MDRGEEREGKRGGAGLFLFSKRPRDRVYTLEFQSCTKDERLNVARSTRARRENLPDANGTEITRT